jgi:hypothetical protein
MLATFKKYVNCEFRESIRDVLANKASLVMFPQIVTYLEYIVEIPHASLPAVSINMGDMFGIHSAFMYVCCAYKIGCAGKCDICFTSGVHPDEICVKTICGPRTVNKRNTYDLMVFSEMYGLGVEAGWYAQDYFECDGVIYKGTDPVSFETLSLFLFVSEKLHNIKVSLYPQNLYAGMCAAIKHYCSNFQI